MIEMRASFPNASSEWGGVTLKFGKVKIPYLGIFLKIEYYEGMLSYAEVNMCHTYRDSVNVVLWLQNWHSSKVIYSNLVYVHDNVLLKF
jgi:hypothetical protein